MVAVFNPSLQDVETAVTYFGKWWGGIQACTSEKKKKKIIASVWISNCNLKINAGKSVCDVVLTVLSYSYASCLQNSWSYRNKVSIVLTTQHWTTGKSKTQNSED